MLVLLHRKELGYLPNKTYRCACLLPFYYPTPPRTLLLRTLYFSTVSLIYIFFLARLHTHPRQVVYSLGFKYPVILSVIQYCITWACLDVLNRLGKFKKMSETSSSTANIMDKELWLLALALGFATPVSNISLKLNSVGLYTISKLLLTPAVVCGDWLLRNEQTSMKRGIILCVLCGAVLLAAETDLEVNVLGSLAVCTWLPLAVMYKVGWAKAIKVRKYETMPLMHHLMPYATMFTFGMALVLEPLPEFFEGEWATSRCVMMLAISGVAAFLVNLSGFLVMGLLR